MSSHSQSWALTVVLKFSIFYSLLYLFYLFISFIGFGLKIGIYICILVWKQANLVFWPRGRSFFSNLELGISLENRPVREVNFLTRSTAYGMPFRVNTTCIKWTEQVNVRTCVCAKKAWPNFVLVPREDSIVASLIQLLWFLSPFSGGQIIAKWPVYKVCNVQTWSYCIQLPTRSASRLFLVFGKQ